MQQRVHLPSHPATVADRVLVRQTLAGDQDAFETLVRRYHVQVFHFIRRYVRDYDQAWEIRVFNANSVADLQKIVDDKFGPNRCIVGAKPNFLLSETISR